MPTIAGLRRRGYTPEGIRLFAARIGVDKTNSRVQMEVLEDAIRDDLNSRAPRVMAVLRPLKVTITNYPAGKVEWLDAPYWPRDIDKEGSRQVPLTARRSTSSAPTSARTRRPTGRASGPAAKCACATPISSAATKSSRTPTGEVVELRCTYDPDSLGKTCGAQRKQSTAIQWVAAAHAVRGRGAPLRPPLHRAQPRRRRRRQDLQRLPEPRSVEILTGALVEPSLASTPAGERFQFVRHGYFVADSDDSRPGALVFNRIVELQGHLQQAVGRARSERSADGQAEQASRAGRASAESRPLAPSLTSACARGPRMPQLAAALQLLHGRPGSARRAGRCADG